MTEARLAEHTAYIRGPGRSTSFWVADRTGPLLPGELDRATLLGRSLGTETTVRLGAGPT